MKLVRPVSSSILASAALRDERRHRGWLRVSLRGTLAATFMHMRRTAGTEAAHAFVRELLDSERPDIVRMLDGTLLIIGLASERGDYWPDW
jgi:hypothetical protein